MIYKTLIDTDVLIWYLRGNQNAYNLIHSLDNFAISLVTHIELVQGMRDKKELKILQNTLKNWGVKTIYINETISARALFYIEEYFLSHSMETVQNSVSVTISNTLKSVTPPT